jgi:radical SAM protein with 4Fe4S-binding SPASM domain
MRLDEAPHSPAWVVLQLLEECNLRCAMCYAWGPGGVSLTRPTLAALDLAVAKRVVEECLPAHPLFELFGGEPLLYPGIWEVIRLITDHGCEVAFPTNGILVEAWAEQLVACRPNRLWISLDGPGPINDAQRGHGVFARVLGGLHALAEEKRRRGSRLPEVGINCVVTPANHLAIAELFLRSLDLSQLGRVSVELQSFCTEAQHRAYAELLREEFGLPAAPHARAYVREPAVFSAMDRGAIARQLTQVAEACAQRGIAFTSQPSTRVSTELDSYLRGESLGLADGRRRCALPWSCAEISARGDVTTCHTFYDVSLGNVNAEPLLDIWRGERMRRWRARLRQGLLPICTACCRYYQ